MVSQYGYESYNPSESGQTSTRSGADGARPHRYSCGRIGSPSLNERQGPSLFAFDIPRARVRLASIPFESGRASSSSHPTGVYGDERVSDRHGLRGTGFLS